MEKKPADGEAADSPAATAVQNAVAVAALDAAAAAQMEAEELQEAAKLGAVGEKATD